MMASQLLKEAQKLLLEVKNSGLKYLRQIRRDCEMQPHRN